MHVNLKAGARARVCAPLLYDRGVVQGLPNANSIKQTSEMALELPRALVQQTGAADNKI